MEDVSVYEKAIEILNEMLNEGDTLGDIRSTDERDNVLKLAIKLFESSLKLR